MATPLVLILQERPLPLQLIEVNLHTRSSKEYKQADRIIVPAANQPIRKPAGVRSRDARVGFTMLGMMPTAMCSFAGKLHYIVHPHLTDHPQSASIKPLLPALQDHD